MTGPLLDQIHPEPRRDRWGRYLLPDPGTGKERAWTRATTWAKTVSDTFALTTWECRMVAAGMARRPDLIGLAASSPVDDKTALDKIAKQAKEAAASSAGANAGTALHKATERADRGEQVTLPAPWDADLAAYQKKLLETGIKVDPQLIERIVVLPALGVAGTFDRLIRAPGIDNHVIFDVKSTKNIAYGWLEIAAQEALYSRAEVMWNGATGEYEPMPEVDRMRGIVAHLPVGQARCDLYEVDLAQGWAVAELCGAVRSVRASAKDMAQPYIPYADEPSDPVHAFINAATTVGELTAIWEHAEREGRWTTEHTQAAKRRKRHLTST